MTFLTITDTIQENFIQYGILGIIAFILGHFAWQQYKRLIAKNDALEIKVDNLQLEMMKLLVEERDRLSDLIRDNTEALQELQKTILKYLVNKK